MPYDVPNYLVDYAMRMTHVPVGFWRCVNHTQNCFFKESFIDEMAHAAGQDPYQYRRKLLRKHPQRRQIPWRARCRRRASAGWGTPPPHGIHRGIALNEVYGTFTAAVDRESRSASDGDVRVHRVVSAHRLRPRGQPADGRDAGRRRDRLSR